MGRATRVSALLVLMITLVVAEAFGAIVGVREAHAAMPEMRSHPHSMVSHHRQPAADANHRSASVAARAIRALRGSCGSHDCMAQDGTDCGRPGMPGGAPCCTAHCAAAPAMAASTANVACATPASTPEWGRGQDLESTPSAPDRPPPRG